MPARSPIDPEAQFDRRAWLTLAAVIALLGSGLAVLTYRFSLPTDGWKSEFIGEHDAFIYLENQMGAPSGLRPGDRVVAVEGYRATGPFPPELQQAWRAGAALTYTVVRDEISLLVPVTLTHWRFGTWLLATVKNPVTLASPLATYLLLAISALVFWRRPGNPAAGAFLLLTTVLATTDLSTATLTSAWPELIDPLSVVLTSNAGGTLLYAIMMPFVLIRFALVFPRPKPILLRFRWLIVVPSLIGLALSLIPGDLGLGWYWFVISLLLMLALLAHTTLTTRDPVSRAQVRWGLSGLIIGFGLLTGMLALNTLGVVTLNQASFSLASAVAFTIIGVTLAIAILRYRLFDIDVLIQRTLVYAALTAVLALVYFGSVVILQGVLRGVSGSESPLVIVVSTLLIAALFAPLRGRVQRAVDRRFYRRKYNAARTLAAFGAQARDETDLPTLTTRLQTMVHETMQPEQVSLWLKER